MSSRSGKGVIDAGIKVDARSLPWKTADLLKVCALGNAGRNRPTLPGDSGSASAKEATSLARRLE